MNRQLTDMETFFKALADSTRRRILGLLMTSEVCVCHIHESLKIPQSKASRHLAYRRHAGLATPVATACGFTTACPRCIY